jgi:hypothetical protein
MMAKVTVEYGELIVEIEGIDALWALRSQLEIPLAHVRGAAIDDSGVTRPPCLDEATHVSGAVCAGRFLQRGDHIYWNVHEPANAIAIALTDDHYARLVVEVDDPEIAVARINRAVAEWRARGCGDVR